MSATRIYELVHNRDFQALDAEKNITSIDERFKSTSMFTAASQLAAENDVVGVHHLLRRHANVNYALYGAALAGHYELMEDLLRLNIAANINYALIGVAQRGDTGCADTLIMRGAHPAYAAIGAAHGGLLDVFIMHAGDSADHRFDYFFISAAAEGGHKNIIDYLLSQASTDLMINTAIAGAACGRRKALLEVLGYNHNQIRLSFAVAGFAMGGHLCEMNELIRKSSVFDRSIWYAAQAGRKPVVDSLITYFKETSDGRTLIKQAACGYAVGGHYNFLKYDFGYGDDHQNKESFMTLSLGYGHYGMHINWDADIHGISEFKVISNFNRSKASKLRFLSCLNVNEIRMFTNRPDMKDLIPKKLAARAVKIHELRNPCRHPQRIPFEHALLFTKWNDDKSDIALGVITIAQHIFLFHKDLVPSIYISITRHIWGIILNKVTNQCFTIQEWEKLSISAAKLQMARSIDRSYLGLFGFIKDTDNAQNYLHLLSYVKTRDKFSALFRTSKKLLIPDSNNKIFTNIMRRWSNRLK